MSQAKSAYDTGIKALKKLAAQGRALEMQILAYKNEVVLPEDFASVGPSGFDPQVFLDGNPCYKDSQDLLTSYGALIASLSREVELSAQIAENLAVDAQKSGKKLKAETALSLLKAPRKTKVDPLPKARGHRKSDVSGTKDKKKKAQ